MGGNDRVVIAVVDRAHVETVGSNDAVVVGRDTEDEAACSMSIGGTGSKSGIRVFQMEKNNNNLTNGHDAYPSK
uniref:Uncharacterized protein n=1 Tax=Romanomermis culicivorax TaxID=13658 RepID=A0A915JJH6_ROMCU